MTLRPNPLLRLNTFDLEIFGSHVGDAKEENLSRDGKLDGWSLVVQAFQNWNLEERNSFFLQNLLLIGEGYPFDISLFGLSKVDFQGLLGKI